MIDHGKNYLKVDHRNIHPEDIQQFFSPGSVALEVFDNFQLFDCAGLEGRLFSSSYMPSRSDAGYGKMVEALRTLFERYEDQEKVQIHYDTKVFIGKF